MKKITNIILTASMILLVSGCFSLSYDFKGGVNIPTHIQSFSVQHFNNRAKLIEPTFSRRFTDELKIYIENNTSLRLLSAGGDVDFSGTITTYQITPQSISAGDKAALTRFTIGVKFEYKDQQFPDEDFEKSVSAFREFESTTSFASKEEELSKEIMDEIIEQIFNAAFVKW